MRTVGTLMGACLFTALLAAPAHGQQLGIYLSASWDSSTGDTYAYAQTASDYATGYWYFLCAGMEAWGQEPDDLSASDYYEGPFGCDSTDAEVDWSFTADATTNYLELFSQHYEYIEYQTYQADPYCDFDYFDCDSYWDDFELSLVGASGDYSGPQFWYLPGPPAITYVEETLVQELLFQLGTYCFNPTGEYSYYLGVFNSLDPGYYNADPTAYAGKFKARLLGSDDYSGRTVQEDSVIGSQDAVDICAVAYPDAGVPAVQSGSVSGTDSWTVLSGNYYANDSVPTNNLTWSDKIGVDHTWVDTYQIIPATCAIFRANQAMLINACSAFGTYTPYANNALEFDTAPTSTTAYRGNAQGAAQ